MQALDRRRDQPGTLTPRASGARDRIGDTVKSLRKEIDNAAFLGLRYVMTFGIDNPAQFDHYFKAMADAAAYGAEKGVFRVLKSAGFNGPIMVECCAVGDTAEATAANARANREFLEKVLAAV